MIETHIDEPLYCYKIHKDGIIRKYTITEYTVRCISKYTQRYCYRFKENLGNAYPSIYDVYKDNLDKLVDRKSYTFSNDDQANYNKLKECLTLRKQKAWEKYLAIDTMTSEIFNKNSSIFNK